jgi:D-alanyl-D-alanine dipeptidase
MPTQRDNEEVRRTFWTNQMESAYGFADKMLEYPVEECGESLISLPQSAREEGVAVQFSQTKLAEDHARLFYFRKGLVEDFIAASREMNERGWTLRVEDGFRSREMQKDLALQESVFDNILQKVIWEAKDKIPDPKLVLRRLTVLIATFPKIGTHMSGSAIDISVLRTDDLSEIERSGSYLELSELTPLASPFASADAIRNRTEISEIMQHHGFIAYPYEFWHYSKGDAYAEYLTDSGNSARYGAVDFDIATGNITPIPNPKDPLHSLGDIEKYIELSLSRVPP